jgi:amidase
MSRPLNELTASELVLKVAAGDVTCEMIARACLERVEARESAVEAWTYLNPEQVLTQAQKLDRQTQRGVLAGVPFGVKDIIDSNDMPTAYGSPIYADYRPRGDAACIALSRKAGALLMGKTVTTEFANRHPGKTRHPLDPQRTPGGSSSGSAAAVADHMVPLAIGTQTTGSTIKPASFCGVFGYKPTHDHLRCAGVMESAHSLDTLGLYARSIEDMVLWRDVLLGEPVVPLPPEPAPIPRIGFCRPEADSVVEATTIRIFEDAAGALKQAGASVQDVPLPPIFGEIWNAHQIVSSFEFSRNLTWEIEHHWDEISTTLRNGRIRKGLETSFDDYVAALRLLEQARDILDKIFDSFDLLLTTPVTGEAPLGLDSTGDSSLCATWTALHVPVLSIPVFSGPNGLPIGAQLIANRHQDRALLSFARWVYRQLS